jgi:hypothetical protein
VGAPLNRKAERQNRRRSPLIAGIRPLFVDNSCGEKRKQLYNNLKSLAIFAFLEDKTEYFPVRREIFPAIDLKIPCSLD